MQEKKKPEKKETVLDYDRDWTVIKNRHLNFIPEDQRDNLLELIVRVAVYN